MCLCVRLCTSFPCECTCICPVPHLVSAFKDFCLRLSPRLLPCLRLVNLHFWLVYINLSVLPLFSLVGLSVTTLSNPASVSPCLPASPSVRASSKQADKLTQNARSRAHQSFPRRSNSSKWPKLAVRPDEWRETTLLQLRPRWGDAELVSG